jgi:hypothetical protein
MIKLIYHNPDTQSNKDNYKGKSCLIHILFGLLVCWFVGMSVYWCVIVILKNTFCFISQRYLLF